MKTMIKNVQFILAAILLLGLAPAYAADKPNIVLVFMDNFGWGEPGFNGGGRDHPRRRDATDRCARC